MVSELYLKYMKGRKKKISRGNGKGREEWEGGENKGGKGRGDRRIEEDRGINDFLFASCNSKKTVSKTFCHH